MSERNFTDLLSAQKAFFAKGHSEAKDFRVAMLDMLELTILKHKEELFDAIEKDLGKSRFDAIASELAPLLAALRYTRNNVKSWMKNKKVRSEFFQLFARSIVRRRPHGVVLIISTWNFPILLSFLPLIDAIAAGNSATIKVSEKTPEVSRVIFKLIDDYFVPDFVTVVEGDGEQAKKLLALDFDFVFFVGGSQVGLEIAKSCIERGIPYALELGGKNLAILLDDADLARSAQNIVWAKTLNAGQVCVSFDELWLPKSLIDPILAEAKKAVEAFFGANPIDSSHYQRLANKGQFERILGFIEGLDLAMGGRFNELSLKIEPTIVVDPPLGHRLYQEEIFGPLLVIRTYEELVKVEEEIEKIKSPLSLYVYTKNSDEGLLYSERFRFGSGGINDAILQYGNPRLPIGGLGLSGVGRLKGRAGFNTFSYEQSVVIERKLLAPGRYPPYSPEVQVMFEKMARLKLKLKIPSSK